MNLKAVIVLLFFSFAYVINAQDANKLNRKSFYDILALENLEKIDSTLSGIENLDFKEKEAYEGALLMKKAALIQGPGKKLSVFKEGHELMERAIKEDSANAEYRFLRLIIQENAPKILGYNNEVETDAAFILENIQTLSPTIQQALLDYSIKSKVLDEDTVRKALP